MTINISHLWCLYCCCFVCTLTAELGDFDYERHTVENLKDLVLLPKVSIFARARVCVSTADC